MFKIKNALLAILIFVWSTQLVLADGSHMTLATKKATFAEVKEAIEMSITGRGLVINNVSHIGDMLARTGKDLGGAKLVYLQGEALEFCSATVSRNMMMADPDNIIFCPYIIAIYVVPEHPEVVRVAYRKTQLVGSPESQKSLTAVNNLLSEIIAEALQ
jgi:uncharacterized protein (DUF302 family)